MAVIPPDLLDTIRQLQRDVRELRGRLPPPPPDEPSSADATQPAE